VITAGSDQSIASSTALTDDTALTFATVNGATYEIQIDMVYGSPAGGGTPDIKIAVGEDATTRGAFVQNSLQTTDTPTAGQIAANQTATAQWGTATTDRIGTLTGVYYGVGGTFKVQWAQVTSGANPTIRRAGSILRYRRIT
jgi:hypothetical protein